MFKDIRDFLVVLGIAIVAGTLMKLPIYFPDLYETQFYPRNVPMIILTALAGVFLLQGKLKVRSSCILFLVTAISFIFIKLFPDSMNSQTGRLALIHLPLFIWALIGLSFRGENPTESRMSYIRLNGDLLMVVPLLLIGGIVFSGIMVGLFGLIDVNIGKFIVEYAVIYGCIGSIMVAAFLIEKLLKNYRALAPIIAQLFTPLFLIFLVIFLVATVVHQKSPYHDRDSLIVFNGLMILILGMVVFSIAGRRINRWTAFFDWINFALVTVTLLLNSVALSAIVFRLASYGLTPNRVSVLGANILIFIHLSGIAFRLIKVFRKSSTIHDLEKWICGYLPIYMGWAGFVTFGFPIIFIGFK